MPRLSIRRIMLLVAALALTMGAFRVHFSLGSFVACVVILALSRTFGQIDRRRKAGEAAPAWDCLKIAGQSMLVSLGIVAPAALVALVTCLLSWIMGSTLVRTSHRGREPGGFSLLFACVAGAWAASHMRGRLWEAWNPIQHVCDEFVPDPLEDSPIEKKGDLISIEKSSKTPPMGDHLSIESR